jgi:thimet oligopeptidase
MHWIFQGQQEWAGYRGNLESDFVEAPSQMLEERMHDPKVLATFARNYQTNQPIPAELVMRANRADAFGRGLWARFQLVYTSVSFDLHNISQEAKLEHTFPQNIKKFVIFKPLTGYSSVYYTYLRGEVIAEDFFSQFNRNDLLTPEVALRYRSTVLEKTGSMPANDLVRRSFLGRPQSARRLEGLDEGGIPECSHEHSIGRKITAQKTGRRGRLTAWRELPSCLRQFLVRTA